MALTFGKIGKIPILIYFFNIKNIFYIIKSLFYAHSP